MDMYNNVGNPTPWLYCGRVGHDVSEGFCSCGGYHRPEDEIRVGTKTVMVGAGAEMKRVEWSESKLNT